MIYCLGLSSELENIQQNLGDQRFFSFEYTDDPDSIRTLEEAELFLIGPSVEQPVKHVQRIVSLDKLLSIIILADPHRYTHIKQSLQFSLSIGKNTTCIVYNPTADYTEIFRNGLVRTQQKRKFRSFARATEATLSNLSTVEVRFDNLGHILEHAPIGAVLVNKDFNMLGANMTFRKMFKLNGSAVSLKSMFPEKHIRAIKRIAHEGVFIMVEDFSGRYYEVSASSVSDVEQSNMILLINDVTEKTEKDRAVNAVLESLPQIAWTAEPDGNLNYLNQGWFHYTGKAPEQGLNEGWVSVTHAADVGAATVSWKQSITAGTPFQQSVRLRRFDGEYRWHLVRAVPLRAKNKQVTMWVGTSTDIHEHVVLTETLERKVNERTKLLMESNAELEQFAHISSHDLQEPLRKIQTFADIIKNESGALDAHANRYVEKIISTSAGMSRLLRDLLKFSKINESETKEIISLDNVIQHVKEDLDLLLAQNNATLHSAGLPTIRARPLQIWQLFYNLIHNSIKYRKPDVAPVISITCKRPDMHTQQSHHGSSNESYWEIIVKDNGIGFDQQYADQIFTVFQRLHSKSAYEGTGIGLAIAKKVVINHGGEIFATSSTGKGTEFHVILPAMT